MNSSERSNHFNFLRCRDRVRNTAIAVAIAFLACSSALGNDDFATESEMRLLPEYCRHAQIFMERYGSREQQDYWASKVGPTFMHMHHHCMGLVAYARAIRADRSQKAWLYHVAVNEHSYVIRLAKSDFVLLPDVLIARAKAHVGMRNDKEALADFQAAQSLQPKYSTTYLEWATFLYTRGQSAGARKIIEEGLRHNPESKALNRMLKELSASK